MYVALDGLKVYEDSSEGDKTRGIHIVVINEFSGIIMAKRTFDTYLAKEEEAMVLFLNLITEGRIVIFTIKVNELPSISNFTIFSICDCLE